MKISKNFVKNIGILILIALFVFLAVQAYPARRTFRGTYDYGRGDLPQDFTFVIRRKEDTYLMYRQYDHLDEGKFTSVEFGRDITVLYCTSFNDMPSFAAVIYNSKLILSYEDASSSGKILKKYKDTEFYIGKNTGS